MLLLLLFVLICPGGGFDNRELCRFTVPIKGSAPGTDSSVRPIREFGALASNEGEPGYSEAGDISAWTDVGEAAHVQSGGLPSVNDLTSGRSAARSAGGGLFCSTVFRRQLSISESSIGLAPRLQKGDCRR